MKTKIINTILQWTPEAAGLLPDIEHMDDTVADYQLLHKLAEVCMQKINSGSEDELERAQEITKVINLLYQGGNQYTRNAIENEFLTEISLEESPGSLKKHLDLFPSELRKGYLKTILEN
ncbi:hypothetical protein FAZ19_08650 [Sphingobacterium alkalisoli]|uniref:DUF7674 domain-containing protein n=1 Tax=Sphingobacterium alkalisoli TaxID=1874115 RepID=A0A4U0H5N8_9SPHI|nr:hypothetical protein [Sphingobacterium alkalisoli]TJY66958.1 hypothetical protein FAZ19_08650 [Sphingobacterium alkalisoli]GGH13134.1 hypothetical protein GCM10011418_13140 [Sphingobacterium alkalisoli]